MVVDESIKHITAQNERFSEAVSHIQALIEERDDLLAVVNQWRGRIGMTARPSTIAADTFVRKWSGSESLPPAAAADAGEPAHQQPELDSLDGGRELPLNTTSDTIPASGDITSHDGSGEAGAILPISVPFASFPSNGLTEVDVQVAAAPSDQAEQHHRLRVPPELCRSDATVQGLHLGTTPPEDDLLGLAQQQVNTQPHAPEAEAYILNSLSSDLEPHNLMSHFGQPLYNSSSTYALPPSLRDERNLNGEIALWHF